MNRYRPGVILVFVMLSAALMFHACAKNKDASSPTSPALAPAFTPSPSLTPAPTPDTFTIVVFPDTQYMVAFYPALWEGMADWVVDNRASRNIVAVLGVGDIVEFPLASMFAEGVAGWDRVKKAGLLYVPAIGNHDYDGIDPSRRGARMYNNHFGPSYFSGRSWYGSNYNASNENFHVRFSTHGNDYLVLSLETYPRDEALAWAQGIVDQNPDRKIIVVTHSYLNPDGTRTLFGDSGGMDPNSNDSQMVWDKFIKVNPGIFLVISGHQTGGPPCNYSTDINEEGGVVHQLFVNYQDVGDGGDGYMAILQFQPALNRIATSVYSDHLGVYDPAAAFTMNEGF